MRPTNPTAAGARNENATNEPNGRWIEKRKCDERSQPPWYLDAKTPRTNPSLEGHKDQRGRTKCIRKRANEPDILRTFVTDRNSTKRTQLRELLVRTPVLETVSDDDEFLRNEAKG